MDRSAVTTTPPLPSGPRPAPWTHGGQLPGSPTRGQSSPSSVGRLSNLFARTRIVSSSDATSPGREKPLPALPPARTPSQMSHQRQNQSPYSPRAISEQRRVSYQDQPPRMMLEQRLPTRTAPSTARPRPVSIGVGPSVSPRGPTGSPSSQRPATQPQASTSGERLPPMPMARRVDISNTIPPTPYGLPPLRASSPYRTPALPRPPIQQQQGTATPPPRPRIDQMRLPPSYEDLYGQARPVHPANPSSVTAEKTPTALPAFPTALTQDRPASAAQASTSASANAATVVEAARPPHSALPSSAPRPTTSQIAGPSTPTAQSRQRATSTTPQTSSPAVNQKGLTIDASLPPAKGQCWGIKRDGGRCSRIVGSTKGRGSPTKDKDTPRTPHRFRHQSAPPTALTATTRSDVFNRGADLSLAPHGSKARPIIFDDDSESSEDEVAAPSDDDDETQLPVFCRQHSNEINKSAGFYSSKKGDYITFADYLPSALLAVPASSGLGAAAIAMTLARLRLALSEPLTAADLQEKGYIYVFEYPDRSDPQSLYLKVGRSIRPMKRMAEWRGQCSSGGVVATGRSGSPAKRGGTGSTEEGEAQPLLRGLFPSEGEAANQSALLVGAHAVTTPGIFGSHRWEKLIHIELSHRAQRLIDDGEVVTCPCGRRHREIFKVSRKELGYQGVKELVMRWERAVRRIVEG